MTTMKAVIAKAYGEPELLTINEIAKPKAKANEVIVKVFAASSSTADVQMLTGKPYMARLFVGLTKPKYPTPGTGFAGMVESVGSEVTTFKAGDRVFGETTLGFSTNAEFVAVPDDGTILPLPDSLSYAEATAMCDGPLTSYNFLKEIGSLQVGQHVLINGASGSLGTAAVQIAKALGAEVTAVCSGRNAGLVRSLGANHVIDYTQKDFTQGKTNYDLIFDTLGKRSFSECKPVLKDDGQYLSPVLDIGLLLQMVWSSKAGSKRAKFAATGLRKPEELKPMLNALLQLMEERKLKVVIDRQYPLEKIAEAHRYVRSGHKKGNVVLTVQH